MAIAVRCKFCGYQFRVSDDQRGKTAPCPRCAAELLVDGRQVPNFDVFISHSTKDKEVADALLSALECAKISCWVAPRDIAPGESWGSSIVNAIANSRIMVLVYSEHSNTSAQVVREVERAVSKGITIMPLRIDETSMSKDMEYFISASHWLDATTPPLEAHLIRLVSTVRGIIDRDYEPAAAVQSTLSERVQEAVPRAATPHRKRYQVLYLCAILGAFGILGGITFRYLHRTPPIPGGTKAILLAPSPIFTNTIGMKFALIDPPHNPDKGAFIMGSPVSEQGHALGETPHQVTLTRAFYMGIHHVTRGEFRKFVQEDNYRTDAEQANDSEAWNHITLFKQEDTHPVVYVTWNDAMAFVDWLNRKERRGDGHRYRLPTEAEWEYACRAGTTTRFGAESDESSLDKTGWYKVNSGGGTHPVGQKQPNAFGLYDMHGNACQWCNDDYGVYPNGPVTDPKGPPRNPAATRVLRGGSWSFNPNDCGAASRYSSAPDSRSYIFGLRVCVDP